MKINDLLLRLTKEKSILAAKYLNKILKGLLHVVYFVLYSTK